MVGVSVGGTGVAVGDGVSVGVTVGEGVSVGLATGETTGDDAVVAGKEVCAAEGVRHPLINRARAPATGMASHRTGRGATPGSERFSRAAADGNVTNARSAPGRCLKELALII